MAVISGLFIYPLKSARGIALDESRITMSGLKWDRHWMAVDSAGRFLSQRTHPLLARVVPELTDDALVLHAPDQSPLRLPLESDPSGSHVQTSVQVWDDSCTGFDQGEPAAQWISQALGVPARLMRAAPELDRLADAKYAGPYPVPIAFPDAFPLLVCNRASLDGLNRLMPEVIPMERFRPNIVLDGLPEFAEDGIDTLQAGEVTLRLVKPCTRCIITSTDQHTGERSTNPLPVLRTFRFSRELLGVTFGENAVVISGVDALLKVGILCVPTFEPTSPAPTLA